MLNAVTVGELDRCSLQYREDVRYEDQIFWSTTGFSSEGSKIPSTFSR